MRYNRVIIVFAAMLLMASTACNSGQGSFDKEAVEAEVKKSMDGMVIAWNKQQLEEALGYYWNSPDLVWINRTGVDKGYKPVFDGYLKGFEDRSKMGDYSYQLLHIDAFSPTTAFMTIKWKIQMGEESIGGISSLIWSKIDGKWVISKEHAS